MYCVTRQMQWPDGELAVCINRGGLDYCGPDALCAKYAGEFEEFTDPRAAAESAISIAESWRAESAAEILLGFGDDLAPCTESESAAELRAWAEREYAALDKCPCCGDPLPGERRQWRNADSEWTGFSYCSEYCAESDQSAEEEEEEEDWPLSP